MPNKSRQLVKVLAVSTLVILLAISLIGFAEEEEESPVFVLRGLKGDLLVSQESRTTWGSSWSAPTASGIIFGYLAKGNYPELVPGEVNRKNVEEVVEKLGTEYTETDPGKGTADPHLIRGLARYLNEKYPNEFKIKVYDTGFNQEFSRIKGESLPAQLYGVPIDLYEDPAFEDYRKELMEGERVWLGLPQEERENNHLLVGRSFDPRQNPQGDYPIDLVEPHESSFKPGKAQIIETTMSPDGVVAYHGKQIPAEIMIALSPREPATASYNPAGAPPDRPCPEGAIDVDVTVNETKHGKVKIKQCVMREELADGTILDTYLYTLTNISYNPPTPNTNWLSGWAIGLPNPGGVDILIHGGPGWIWAGWAPAPEWDLPSGTGLKPGQKAQFSYSVKGATSSVDCPGWAHSWEQGGGQRDIVDVSTTCPVPEEPDLVTEVPEVGCTFTGQEVCTDWEKGECTSWEEICVEWGPEGQECLEWGRECTDWERKCQQRGTKYVTSMDFITKNIGGAPAGQSVATVELVGPDPGDQETKHPLILPLKPGEKRAVKGLEFETEFKPQQVKVCADDFDSVQEANEGNNCTQPRKCHWLQR